MSERRSVAALQEYRRLQDLEGATLESEYRIAAAQGQAWREYVAACDAESIEPESMSNPSLRRW